MPRPELSEHARRRLPSAIRVASILFEGRRDGAQALNVAIGNVSLPMHPAMLRQLRAAGEPGGPFGDGVVRYTATIGRPETRAAFLHVIAASGFDTQRLFCQITDGGSQAMELVIVAMGGPAGSSERPILLIDAAYTNYQAFADRLGRSTISISRTLDPDGAFALPALDEIAAVIERRRPGAMVVIPYDNPTGQFYSRETMASLARICVEHGLWMVSDEAYRELHYTGAPPTSIWGLSEEDAPGISGRRASIETASKVWNACGLRIGALVTDDEELHRKCVAENTASLCASAIGQQVFAALADETTDALRDWFAGQRAYYGSMMRDFVERMREALPGVIVSRPDAALYSVVDVRELVDESFEAAEFVSFCAREGAVEDSGDRWTVLAAPMAEFYHVEPGAPNPGRTQLRIAYVLSPEDMARVPRLLAELLRQHLKQ